jgi:hypothetical protein
MKIFEQNNSVMVDNIKTLAKCNKLLVVYILRLSKIKQWFYCMLFFIFSYNHISAQIGVSPAGNFRNYNPIPSSPNVAAFQKYGDLPVNHNTGVPQIDIPVYTIALNGFSWPISLSYHASGFKSEDVATRVGLGWTLNCNGVISSKQSEFGAGINFDLRRDLNLTTHINSQDLGSCYYNDNNDVSIADNIVNGQYRVSPDMFYLNSCSINGKFLDNGYMLPASDIKITSLGLVPNSYGHIGWKIKDENGNVYDFLDKGENIRSSACQGMVNMQFNPSYYLSKISTPSGETLDFIYENENFSYKQPDLHIVKSLTPNQLTGCASNIIPEDYYCQNNLTAIEKRLLKIISSTGIEVSFIYSGRNDIPASSKLDKIKILNTQGGNTTVTKTIELLYSYFGTGTNPDNLQLKLNSVSTVENSLVESQKYNFIYNNTPLPSKTAPSYWQGNYVIGTWGILEKIQYPTGGYTTFGYEASNATGSLRVKEIRDVGINNAETGYRIFEYGQPSLGYFPFQESETVKYFGDPSNGGPLSGVNEGNYCSYAPGLESLIIECSKTVDKSTPVKNTIIDLMGDASRYTTVTELFGNGGNNGKIEYKYGSYDFGDRNQNDVLYLTNSEQLKEKNTYKKNSDGSFSLVAKLINQYEVPSSNDNFYDLYTGNLKEKRFWIKTMYRTREEMLLVCPGNGQFCFPKQYFTQNFRISSVPLYLKKEIQENYEGTQKIQNIKTYYYENPLHLKPTKIEVLNSKGELITTTNKYVFNFSGSSVYDEMINKNMISPVVEQVKKNITKNKELEYVKTNYQLWNSNTLIEPASILQSVMGNTPEVETNINSYTTNGKITQLIGKDGVVTSFIWGYNQQYPVAKIIGKSYIDAINQSGVSLSFINNPTNDNTMRVELAKLRTLSGAFVTSYTYRPLVGITSETDVNNKSVYYEYDGYNRLALMRDKDNNIIKKICYNFYGQIESCSGQGNNPVWVSTENIRCKRCTINTNFYAGIKEVTQVDINPSSPSYNQTRWVDYSNDNSCLESTDWVFDNSATPYCEFINGLYTGNQVKVQKNINPCSPFYNQQRNYPEPNCISCPASPIWLPTGFTRCEMNAQNNFTGNLQREEYNSKTCSSIPYGTTRWIFDSYNPSVCSATGCNSHTCTGEGYKCISNVCVLGTKIYTLSTLIDPDNYIYNCIYHYEYSDGSWSENYSETSYSPCL